MYLRYTTRKKDGKVHRTWRLVRSVRIGRRVIQQTVTHLGELDEAGRLRARALARLLIGEPEQADLFEDGTRAQTIGVRLKGVRIESGRQFGNVFLALTLWHACRLDEFTAAHVPAGKEEVPWEKDFPGLTAKEIARIERGEVKKPHQRTLAKIARRIGIRVEEISTTEPRFVRSAPR